MASSAALRIRLTVAISILALVVSAIGFGVARSIQRAETAEYQRRCSLYAVALASTSAAWLPSGDSTHEQFRYPLLSLGVVYLRVTINGEIVMDLRRPEFTDAQLPQLDQYSLAGTSVVCFEDHWAIDVAVPHMLPNVDDPEEDGTLRTLQFGIGATELAAANQQTTRKVALISLTAWVFVSVLLVGLCILVRSKQRFAATQPPSIPDAARRSAAGDLVLLHDELRFIVGEAEIGLTPKQAVLLELLIRQPGRAFSDTEILCHVWCDSTYANSSDVKQQVYLIRKRLSTSGMDASKILVTVPGVGYKLVISQDDGTVDAVSTDQPHS